MVFEQRPPRKAQVAMAPVRKGFVLAQGHTQRKPRGTAGEVLRNVVWGGIGTSRLILGP